MACAGGLAASRPFGARALWRYERYHALVVHRSRQTKIAAACPCKTASRRSATSLRFPTVDCSPATAASSTIRSPGRSSAGGQARPGLSAFVSSRAKGGRLCRPGPGPSFFSLMRPRPSPPATGHVSFAGAKRPRLSRPVGRQATAESLLWPRLWTRYFTPSVFRAGRDVFTRLTGRYRTFPTARWWRGGRRVLSWRMAASGGGVPRVTWRSANLRSARPC